MWSGPAALQNLDRTLQSVRHEVVRLDAQLSSITSTLADLERRRVKIIRDIAAVRLVEIERGALSEGLSSADREAAEMLKERDQAWQGLVAKIDELNAHIELQELEREKRLDELNQVSQTIVDREAEVQAELGRDAMYLAQLERVRQAESIATEAAQKVTAAQADMARKAEPYQKDKLFTYLWERGFGTSEYSAGLFSRFMDSWVANLIDFEPARANYWNLTEIPKRLQQHSDGVAQVADEAIMELQQLELEALAKAGVSEQEDNLAALRVKIDERDDVLESAESELNALLAERALYIAGDDAYIKRCLSTLADALNHADLRAVHRYVQVTHSPTDDELVIELQELDTLSSSHKNNLAEIRQLHNKQLQRLQEIEEVRRNFKNSRFDDVRSGFNNESLLASVLAQFVQGVVSGSDLWRVIKRSQQYRDVGSLPDFGSGGFGNIGEVLGSGLPARKRRQRKSSWHWPKPRRGGGGFNFPGSGGDGGFRTGGGF